MDDIHPSSPAVLLGALVVLLVLLSALAAVKRRRRGLPSGSTAAVVDTIDVDAPVRTEYVADPEPAPAVLPIQHPESGDGQEGDGSVDLVASSDFLTSREHRRIVDGVLGPGRRSPGRHSAEAPAPSGVLLLLLVPTAVKRRRRLLDVGPQLVSAPTGVADDVAARTSPEDHARDREALAAAVDENHAYRRRVNATIQAISRRIGEGDRPELIESRMLAALDRLDGPVGFARPRLSPSGSDHPVSQIGHTPPAASLAGHAALPPPLATEASTEEPGPGPGGAHPEAFPSEDAEVVLPVPPLPSAPTDTRRRGLLRRGKGD